MSKIYLVCEDYDIDGGHGNSVSTQIPLYAFKHEKNAKEYVRKNNNPHIYDRPYDSLYEGGLHYIPIHIKD